MNEKELTIVGEKIKEGTIDYDIPLQQAEQMEVKFRGKMRRLKWMAHHHPSRLEVMMDTMEPGSVLFSAITTVYNGHLDKILVGVNRVNARIQKACVEGLANYRRKMTPRPVTYQSTSKGSIVRRRAILQPEAMAELLDA